MEGYDRFCTYVGEGMNVSVAVTRTREGSSISTVPGRCRPPAIRQICGFQRMLGHLSVLGIRSGQRA